MSEIAQGRVGVHIAAPVAKAVKKGHPWVYDQGVTRVNREGSAGDLAVLYDPKREFVGIGLYDPESPIRVRVLHRGKPIVIDAEWLKNRIEEAFAVRAELLADPDTTGYRLVSGENDRLPGLVADVYDTTLVLKLDTAAWIPHLPVVQAIFEELIAPERIVLRMSRTVKGSRACPPELTDGCMLKGDAPQVVVFKEHGILFEADPVAGQKTGFFLDQRENRARVEGLSRHQHVLNVFSYTGGFSLYAARGGAKSVISLDLSAPALEASVRNFALNKNDRNIAETIHETYCADAFEGMAKLAREGKKFGVVVVDPPSFARKQTDVPAAVNAYERLIKLALNLLEPDGVLVAASCSARVTSKQFFDTVTGVLKKNRIRFREIERTEHAVDHPVGFPEGAYLKCFYARLLR